MPTTILEKNTKDFMSGKISPADYASHIIRNKPINRHIEKITLNANKLSQKIKRAK